jgi:dihydrofolate synthase/folylpolyglutamate synthase
LVDFRERIRVDGKPIPESAVVEFVETYLPCADSGPRPPSFFEWTFAMAVWWFRRSAVELAVLETGMGGRLDSTNVFRAPWATAITNVGLDHQQFLGPDIRSIAAEKAGILKDCRPVVVGRMRPEALSVVLGQALRTSSEVYYADSAHEPALPNEAPYAAENRATARKLLDVLASLPEWDSTRPCALSSAPDLTASGHYGRWQWLAPAPSGARILADCAHNVDGLNALFGSLPAHGTLHVVYGTVADKSLAEVFPLLPRTARWYFCAADIPRALPPSDLAHIAGGARSAGCRRDCRGVRGFGRGDGVDFCGGRGYLKATAVATSIRSGRTRMVQRLGVAVMVRMEPSGISKASWFCIVKGPSKVKGAVR